MSFVDEKGDHVCAHTCTQTENKSGLVSLKDEERQMM